MMRQSILQGFILFLLSGIFPAAASETDEITLAVRQRDSDGKPFVRTLRVSPKKVGIAVVDMWDSHGDLVVLSRMEAMIPRLNQTLQAARDLGMTIFYVPSQVRFGKHLEPTRNQRRPIKEALKRKDLPPMPPFPGNGFFWPMGEIPHKSTETSVPPSVQVPSRRRLVSQHPDIEVKDSGQDLFLRATRFALAAYPGSWRQKGLIELYKTTQALGISHLIYAGIASNKCVQDKDFGMINMKRLGYEVFAFSDLADASASAGNGINWDQGGVLDPSMSPDKGNREVNAWIEQTYDGMIPAAEILTRFSHRFG